MFANKRGKGLFHQGNDKFGETKGIHCSCTLHFGIAFSAFKEVNICNANDLEYVIEQGDILYKSTGSTGFLSCPELPHQLTVEHVNVNLLFTDNVFGFLHTGSNCLPHLIDNLMHNSPHTVLHLNC